jgi:RNA polymerase sigma-70 factor (ECF subfamily)
LDGDVLFRRYHLPIFRFLKRMTGSRDRAEDLTQEVFVRVVRARKGPAPGAGERAWLFTIARNLLLNLKRDSRLRTETLSLDETRLPFGAETQPDAVVLQEALAGLPALDREVFLMREIGGLGYDEIAAVCEITPDAVRSRIYRARVGLRDALRVARWGSQEKGP